MRKLIRIAFRTCGKKQNLCVPQKPDAYKKAGWS